MNPAALGLLIPVILTVHNAEEYFAFKVFKRFYLKFLNKKLQNRTVFLYAICILTLFASVICISNYFLKSKSTQLLTTIVVISLLLNGIQHCISSLRAREFLPGTFSSLLLLIPYSLIYLEFLQREIRFGLVDLLFWCLLAALFMIASIYASFRIGHIFHSFLRGK